MPHILLVDETFDINFTQEYNLSIQLSLDGFSFCILDSLQNKYIYLFHKRLSGNPQFIIKKLTAIYAEFEILEAKFKTTQIIFSSPGKTSLIPEHLFSEDNAIKNYQFNRNMEDGDELYHIPIPKLQSILQAVIPQKVKTFLHTKYPTISIQNDYKILLDHCVNSGATSPLLAIQIYTDQISISVIDQTIRFFNSFNYSNENDLLYYILNISKTLQYEEINILLNGIVNKQSAIFHRLRQYFKHVTIMERNSSVYYSYLFDQLPDARFVNLLNSYS